MNIKILVTALILALTGGSVSAATLQVDFSVTNDNSNPLLTSGLPLGAEVTGSLTFDVDDTQSLFSSISNVTGSMAWNNGTSQSFAIDRGNITSAGSSGYISLALHGVSSATFGTRTIFLGHIYFSIGTNPFMLQSDFSDVLLSQGTVPRLGFSLVDAADTHKPSIYFSGAPSSTFTLVPPMSSVPLPAGFPILLTGLTGFVGLRMRQRRTAQA
ncbi:hypothetical protein E4Z66_06265 [Aliishimia ponticola]|uniref:VPLPA-CTERM sorting domain-containing protein n=1 Tax=Aliishimia ponticola TaxID=2499833 RepID=A0A4S4NLH4_9RHOB|nr:VPLPA-CTERM sorting domain-containing protein [Aliishimia ponticola]THH39148.1 hypothetical protein E4Z66_06265 [Aliishimia ponticola]